MTALQIYKRTILEEELENLKLFYKDKYINIFCMKLILKNWSLTQPSWINTKQYYKENKKLIDKEINKELSLYDDFLTPDSYKDYHGLYESTLSLVRQINLTGDRCFYLTHKRREGSSISMALSVLYNIYNCIRHLPVEENKKYYFYYIDGWAYKHNCKSEYFLISCLKTCISLHKFFSRIRSTNNRISVSTTKITYELVGKTMVFNDNFILDFSGNIQKKDLIDKNIISMYINDFHESIPFYDIESEIDYRFKDKKYDQFSKKVIISKRKD